MPDVKCSDHSGFCAEIEHLKEGQTVLFQKFDALSTTLNRLWISATLLLGGVVIDIAVRLYTSIPKK